MKKPSIEIHSAMDEYSFHALGLTGLLFILYILCGIGYTLFPVLMLLIFATKEPVLPIFIPFVDFDTKEGCIITSIYHGILLYVACAGLCFADSLFTNLVINVMTMTELQCNQLAKLNDELAEPKHRILAIQFRLVNIFKMNQEMEK